MKFKRAVSVLLAIIACAFLFIKLNTRNIAQTLVPCEPPPGVGAEAAWKTGATVIVYIDATFGTTRQDIIATQIGSWNTKTRFGITFAVKTTASGMGPGAASGGNATWFIFRQIPLHLGAGAQGETGGFSYQGRRGDTTTYINPGVTTATALAQVASHEVGHTFGLDDCSTCAPGSSAMTLPPSGSLNALGVYAGPTQCDVCAVGKNYLSLPTATCTPSTTPSPSPTATPQTQETCEAAGLYWNFTTGTCEEPIAGGGCWTPVMYTCDPGQYWDTQTCSCETDPTPVLVDLAGDGFSLSDKNSGVSFDLNSNGFAEKLSWTKPDSDDAWLVLDRNGNRTIDNGTELFGNYTPQPEPASGEQRNGFLALAEYDKVSNGGNGDGLITESDAIFSSLRLWKDSNHNGISEAAELISLQSAHVATLELAYKTSKYTDEYGNEFRYRAKVKDTKGSQVNRWMWDVFLIRAP